MPAATRKAAKPQTPDPIAMLMKDHREVEKMFKEFEKIEGKGSNNAKAVLVQKACAALTVHLQIEEEIVYPAMRKALDAEDLLDEAEVEHDSVKQLIADLEEMGPGDELYDAKFTVLAEYVKHHVKEEEDELFPKAKKAKMDVDGIAEKMVQRKQELEAEVS